MEPFLTIKQTGTAELEIKKSRFLCSIAQVTDETEARQFIANVAQQNPKANHNCYAYMIGDDNHIQRESDDGEPSGTAGVPILNVLQQENLHNLVAVVTRYFGGIKLGAGGLIRAYSNSASNGIREIGIVERVIQTELQLVTDYSSYEKLAYYLKKNDLNSDPPEFSVIVKLSIYVDKDSIETIKSDITSLLAGNVKISTGKERYQERPYDQKK